MSINIFEADQINHELSNIKTNITKLEGNFVKIESENIEDKNLQT